MKILYIYKSIAKKAGTERILTEKMNYLCRAHEVHIVTYEQGEHPIAYELNPNIVHKDLNVRFFTIYNQHRLKRISKHIRLRNLFKRRLSEYVNEIVPDIIVCTTYAAPLMGIIHRIALSCNAKWVIESHTIMEEIKKANDFSNPIAKALAEIWDKYTMKVMNKCDSLVLLTTKDASSWNKIKNIHVIPNSIIYPKDIIDKKEKTIISVGRLEHEKGYDLLIDSWNIVNKRHPEWKLKIFGEGSMKRTLIEKIHLLQLNNNAEIIPPIDNIYEEYMKSAIYVSSSRFEGFGLTIAESMACGTPCVAFDCPYGPRSIIRQNEDGILVEKMDIMALADKLCFLIEHEDIRIKLGKNARINIKRFATENVMNKWDELFCQLSKQ